VDKKLDDSIIEEDETKVGGKVRETLEREQAEKKIG
jgi:hypothetical protein